MREKERRVLVAATRLFMHLGFDGASTRAIARAAGVTEKTVFRQFGSKGALFERCLGRIVAPVGFATPMELALQLEPFPVAIRSFAEAFLAAHTPERIRAIVFVELYLPRAKSMPLVGAARGKLITVLADRIRAAQAAGEARAYDAIPAAMALCAALHAHVICEGIGPDAGAVSLELPHAFVDLWLAAFEVHRFRRQRVLSLPS